MSGCSTEDAAVLPIIEEISRLQGIIPPNEGSVSYTIHADGTGYINVELWGADIARRKDDEAAFTICSSYGFSDDSFSVIESIVNKLNGASTVFPPEPVTQTPSFRPV